MKHKLITLTPEYAETLLNKVKNNRRVRQKVVSNYAADISAGKWVENGAPIILSSKDVLLDGQHRCHAVIMAGRSITALLVYDVADKNAFATLDTGAGRKLPDILYMKGEKSYFLLSGVINLVHAYENRTDAGLPRKKLNNQSGMEFLKTRGDIRDSVEITEQLRSQCKTKILKPSVGAAAHFIGHQLRQRKTEQFIESLYMGTDLYKESPILVLREKLLRAKTTEGTLLKEEEFAWVIKAWNAFVAGENVRVIRWERGKEAYPSFVVR